VCRTHGIYLDEFTTIDSRGGAFLGAEGCHDANGGVAGGQIGYRRQAASWVFGVEAQGNWADLHGLIFGDTNRSRIDAFGLFTRPESGYMPGTTSCST
jgi:hypothetical protein